MRFRSVPLVLGLFASLWAVKSTEADFLIAQDFKGKSISSIAYTYSGSTAVKGAEAAPTEGVPAAPATDTSAATAAAASGSETGVCCSSGRRSRCRRRH